VEELIALLLYHFLPTTAGTNGRSSVEGWIHDVEGLSEYSRGLNQGKLTEGGENESIKEKLNGLCAEEEELKKRLYKKKQGLKVHQLIVAKVGTGPIFSYKRHSFNTNGKL